MRNIYVLLIFFVLALFIAGCVPTQKTSEAFVGGNVGLQTTYLPSAPPDEIFDGGQSGFSIVVDLNNVGEDDVLANEGYVQIQGLDPGSYGVDTLKKPFPQDIRGAKKNFDGTVLNGDRAQVEFGELKYLPVIQGNLQQTVWADICYIYTTKATTQLCVKKDPQLLIKNDKICDVEGEKNPQNSGGPIHVSSLKESFAGSGKIGVTMILEHDGTGDAFFDPREDLCDDSPANSKRGKIFMKVLPVKLGTKEIIPQCSGLSEGAGKNEGYIRLYEDGSGKERYSLYCTIDASSTENIFEVPVDVEMTYRYLQHIDKELTIRHVAK